MNFDLASIVIGVLIGALAASSLIYPRLARALGKTSAVVLLGCGAALLTWGLYTAIRGEEFREMYVGPLLFVTVGQTLAWAAGCLAAGITALVISFVSRSR